MGKTMKISLVSIAAACAAMLLAAFGLFGGGRTDVTLIDYYVTPQGILIEAGVSGSAGYIRTVKVRENGGDAMAEFYSTFGINNPTGAQREFLLEVSPDCQRILFRRGKRNFRPVLEKDREGNWVRSEGNAGPGE